MSKHFDLRIRLVNSNTFKPKKSTLIYLTDIKTDEDRKYLMERIENIIKDQLGD